MADELSLVIKNPNEGEFLKHIEWNKEQFMELVASMTEQYEGVTYTDEQIKIAKSDRATLNAKMCIRDRSVVVITHWKRCMTSSTVDTEPGSQLSLQRT